MNVRHAFVWSPAYECDIGRHVFPTDKYRAVRDRLAEAGLLEGRESFEPPPPERVLLALAHDHAYLDDLEAARLTPRTSRSELPVTPDVIAAFTRCAAGTALAARRALETGAAAHAGGGLHHAYADHAEGFCYVNDLAVAAQALRAARHVERVAIVDLDVHQGNGTAAIFRDVPEVFTMSLHQERNYPEPKEPGDLDVGLADGVGDEEYLAALDVALPVVWAHEPELVLYQAGADPFHADQLGGLALTFEGLEARDRRVIDGCATRGIPVVVTLGGGYARESMDTVRIHATTCRIAFEVPERRRTS